MKGLLPLLLLSALWIGCDDDESAAPLNELRPSADTAWRFVSSAGVEWLVFGEDGSLRVTGLEFPWGQDVDCGSFQMTYALLADEVRFYSSAEDSVVNQYSVTNGVLSMWRHYEDYQRAWDFRAVAPVDCDHILAQAGPSAYLFGAGQLAVDGAAAQPSTELLVWAGHQFLSLTLNTADYAFSLGAGPISGPGTYPLGAGGAECWAEATEMSYYLSEGSLELTRWSAELIQGTVTGTLIPVFPNGSGVFLDPVSVHLTFGGAEPSGAPAGPGPWGLSAAPRSWARRDAPGRAQ